ncbi:BON domain-containing protein [Pedobacter sp. N23S346]|uniref:BON domain-containing protein n=1 Tax=Pedobacter sp. N23S346 TaxID=3402750 RepID=UPI003AC66EBD
MKKKNKKLEQNVRSAIINDSLIKVENIEVLVEDGVVTLTGLVDSYAKKLAAEHAAKSVKDVKKIIQKIDVWFSFKSNLIIFMGTNLVLNSRHSYKNDSDQPMNHVGPVRPDFHHQRSGRESW